jgi:hypothetical protein
MRSKYACAERCNDPIKKWREMMPGVGIDDEALHFFNRLSGRLIIGLSEPPQPMSERLINLVARPTSQLENVSLVMQVFLQDSGFRELTEAEWERVVLRSPAIRMRGETEAVVEHTAPDGTAFTVRDLTAAIVETERRTRGGSEWFGGIDVHHIFFEGIYLADDGVWSIGWGS